MSFKEGMSGPISMTQSPSSLACPLLSISAAPSVRSVTTKHANYRRGFPDISVI